VPLVQLLVPWSRSTDPRGYGTTMTCTVDQPEDGLDRARCRLYSESLARTGEIGEHGGPAFAGATSILSALFKGVQRCCCSISHTQCDYCS